MDDNSRYTGAYADLLTQIAENVEAVYAAGVKSEYDRFWDTFQENGNRTNYDSAFYGWTDECFAPKYPIIPSGDVRSVFQTSSITQIDEEKFSTENATILRSLFQETKYLKVAPPLNLHKVTRIISVFYISSVETARLYNVPENATWETAFNSASRMTNLIIEGVIGKNIDVSPCVKLTHDSLMSIINALKSGVSGLTCTLGATNLAKLTDAEKAIATEKGWTLA